MKKIFASLAILIAFTTSSFALQGEMFNFQENTAGGIVGNSAIYIYHMEDTEIPKTSSEATTLSVIAKKKLCDNKDIRELIEAGILKEVQYVYVGQKRSAVVIIENCD